MKVVLKPDLINIWYSGSHPDSVKWILLWEVNKAIQQATLVIENAIRTDSLKRQRTLKVRLVLCVKVLGIILYPNTQARCKKSKTSVSNDWKHDRVCFLMHRKTKWVNETQNRLQFQMHLEHSILIWLTHSFRKHFFRCLKIEIGNVSMTFLGSKLHRALLL